MLLSSLYGGNYAYWQLNHKVTFDGENKLIIVNDDVTTLDAEIDIYSDWKEWVRVLDNSKYEQALSPIGGNPTTGGEVLGKTFFLINGWKMRSWEGDHSLLVVGNLFTDTGEEPFVPTIFNHSIVINFKVSNLIEQINDTAISTLTLPQRVWDAIVNEYSIPDTFADKIRRNLMR